MPTTYTGEYGLAVERIQRMFRPRRLRYMSSEGVERFAEFARDAACVDANSMYASGSHFVTRLRVIAACLPAMDAATMVRQVLDVIDNQVLTTDAVAKALFPLDDPTIVERLHTALDAVWNGATQREAAATAGVARSTLQDALAWLGTEQALADERLDTAIIFASENYTPAELAARLRCSDDTARRLLAKARTVIAELAK